MPVSFQAVSPFDWLHSDVTYDISIPLANDVTKARTRACPDVKKFKQFENGRLFHVSNTDLAFSKAETFKGLVVLMY